MLEVLENAARPQAPPFVPKASLHLLLSLSLAKTIAQLLSSTEPSNSAAVYSTFNLPAVLIKEVANSSQLASASIASMSKTVKQELRQYIERWECNLYSQSVLLWELFLDLDDIKTKIERFVILSII